MDEPIKIKLSEKAYRKKQERMAKTALVKDLLTSIRTNCLECMLMVL